MNDEKQAVLSAIQKINAVEGFDPTPLAVEYVDLNTQEKRLRLPVMAQLPCIRSGHRCQGLFCSYGAGLSQLHKPA